MLITRDSEIAGLPAVQARALMRTIRDYAVSLGEIAQLLDSSPDAARAVAQRLEEQGYLCRVEPFARSNVVYDPDEVPPGGTYEDLEYWGTTVTGNGLAKARIGKPMPRPKAAKLLDELLDRAATVNADDDWLFSVERIELFGSFADPDRQEVGDVDARVVFDRRVDGDQFMRRASAAATEAEAKGRRFNNPLDRLSFVELEPGKPGFFLLSDMRPDPELAGAIGARVEPVPSRGDCADGLLEAYWDRLRAYLDEEVRRGISGVDRRPARRQAASSAQPPR